MEKKNLLSLIVLIFVTIISFIFWFTWQNTLEVSANLTIYLAGILILIPLITILDTLFLLGRKGFVITALVLSMLPVLYIGQAFIVYAAIAFIFGFIGLFLTYQSFLRNEGLYKKFSLRHRLPSKNILLVLIFSLSLLTTGKAALSNKDFVIKIPDQVFDLASKMSSSLISGEDGGQAGLSGSMANQTFDREIPRLKSELASMGVVDEKTVNEQIETARKAYQSQIANVLEQNKNPLNSAIESQMKTVRDSIDRQLTDLLSPYLIYLPYLIGLSFFLTLTFFSAFFTLISDFLFMLLFKALLFTGLIVIKTRSEEVEFLEI